MTENHPEALKRMNFALNVDGLYPPDVPVMASEGGWDGHYTVIPEDTYMPDSVPESFFMCPVDQQLFGCDKLRDRWNLKQTDEECEDEKRPMYILLQNLYTLGRYSKCILPRLIDKIGQMELYLIDQAAYEANKLVDCLELVDQIDQMNYDELKLATDALRTWRTYANVLFIFEKYIGSRKNKKRNHICMFTSIGTCHS